MNYNCTTAAITPDKSVVDGAFCGAVYRRLSRPLSGFLAPRLTANAVTAIDFAAGLLSAVLFAAGFEVSGVFFLQLFSVLSCADGEVARLRGETSNLGDYFDTMVDRSVELLVIVAVIAQLVQRGDPSSSYMTGLCLLGGTFLLTMSTAKFRSAFGRDYPKRTLERWFSWISAGSDARLAIISAGALSMPLTGNPIVFLGTLQLLCVAVYANLILRLFIIRAHTKPDGTFEI